jgi:hypothetical protein
MAVGRDQSAIELEKYAKIIEKERQRNALIEQKVDKMK